MPLWALAPEEPPPSRVVNVPIHNSCTAEAMHPPLDGSLMFLPRPWSPLGKQNEHFAWLWRLAEGPGPEKLPWRVVL